MTRPTESRNEVAARRIVSLALGVPVERHEDGKAPSQVDALIKYPSGDAALEIIADVESAFEAQWNALEKYGRSLQVPGLRSRWSVQIKRTAQVRKLQTAIGPILLDLQAGSHDALPDAAVALGVTMAYPIEGEPVGEVHFHPQGWSGLGGLTIDELVSDVLRLQDDVPAKLAAHQADEKHAFIWVTIGSSHNTQSQLENRPQPLPKTAPFLPDGVTHVWVAGSFSSQGCLAWFPDRGWWRAPDYTAVDWGDDE